ncbi:MAG: hypothetical protein ACOX5Z_08200 [Desulfobulbus sp.]
MKRDSSHYAKVKEFFNGLLYLKANQDLILKDGVKRGPTVHSLIADFIENLEIPKIPIEKQRQIAARLKVQLAEVDKARQAAEAQLRDINLLPQKILEQAFQSTPE